METVKYMWVNIWCMLDWVVGLAEIQFLDIVAQLVSAQNQVLLWLAGMNYVKIRTHCKAYYLAQHGETRNYGLETELKMDASQTVKE